MKVIVKIEDLIDNGLWDIYCDNAGINPYAINEGLCNPDDTIEIEKDTAITLGIIQEEDLW